MTLRMVCCGPSQLAGDLSISRIVDFRGAVHILKCPYALAMFWFWESRLREFLDDCMAWGNEEGTACLVTGY
jgi:hypothetical protein